MSGMTPDDIANESLDAIGWTEVLGTMEDGSHHAQVILRKYNQCLMQLLRAANWSFARKSAPLLLLADASGNTPLVGTKVPVPGFIYEYALPTDCMRARYVPWNNCNPSDVPQTNIETPETPLMTGIGTLPSLAGRIRPARFLVSSDFNYPPPSSGPASWETVGISPTSRTVVLTNVRNADLVYTALVQYPSVWDSLFRSAFVAYLASEVALPIWAKTDRKFGLQIRAEQIAIVRQKTMEARIIDGNASGPSTSDISVDWMRTRQVGGTWDGVWRGGGWGVDGPGVWGYSDADLVLADGASF